MKTPLLAVTTLLAALAWTVALIVSSEPFESAPSLLIGVGLVVMATVATVGMIVVSGRWARRIGLITLGFTVILAMVRPVDFIWVMATITTGAAFVALLSPALTASIRRLPAAAGPPPRAVTAPLLLLAAPCALGMVGNDATVWALVVVGLSAPNVALLYSRVLPGGLAAIRLIWPITAIALSPLLGVWAGTTAVLIAVGVAAISWDRSVKASYHPPREVGTTFPIPPELAPTEVLDAAEIDDQGRPR